MLTSLFKAGISTAIGICALTLAIWMQWGKYNLSGVAVYALIFWFVPGLIVIFFSGNLIDRVEKLSFLQKAVTLKFTIIIISMTVLILIFIPFGRENYNWSSVICWISCYLLSTSLYAKWIANPLKS